MPRPPLRSLALRTRRDLRHRRRVAASRLRAGAARTTAYAVARLDAYVWQPATWPFRPAQREMLARALAVLSVAAVALGWIAAYNTLTPAGAARPPAPPPSALKQFTARVAPRPLHRIAPLTVEVPLPVAAPQRRRHRH